MQVNLDDSKEISELRSTLGQIVCDKNAENWWKPELFEKNTLPILPIELEIITPPPDEEQNYNCFSYVLGLHKYPELLGNCGWEFTRNLGPVFDEMIEKSILKNNDIPSENSMIVYRAHDGSISHVGLMEDANTVVSKWSWGPLLRHKISAVPDHYGNAVEFYSLSQDVVDYVLAKRVE